MAFVLSTMTYPNYKATELGKKYLELAKTPLPSYMKITHIFATTDPLYGIKGYVLYEIEDDKLFDGIKEIGKRMNTFREIKGWKYNIETLLEVKDALSLIGLA